MNAKWKRNTVVATMAVLVCAAVALNWKFSGQEAAQKAEEAGTKILGEATLVSGQEDGAEGAIMRNIVLFSVLVYELVGPLLTKMALTKAGEITPNATSSRGVVPSVPNKTT